MKHELAIARDIYARKGLFKGFYAGSLPNLTRCILKNTYRYPLMVGLPNLYKELLPSSMQENKKVLKLFTGISIGFLEATILCPVERVKVHFMTQAESGGSYRNFFAGIRGNLFNELFRGFTPLLVR